MDVEALIASVQKRPPIWDGGNKLHANRDTLDLLWKEISDELGCEEMLLRRKWKYLRDNFAVEYSKCFRRGATNTYFSLGLSKWVYLRPLLFLKSVVRPRLKHVKGARPFDETGVFSEENSCLDMGLNVQVKQEDSLGHVTGEAEEYLEPASDDIDNHQDDEYDDGQESFGSDAAGVPETHQPSLPRGHKRKRDQDELSKTHANDSSYSHRKRSLLLADRQQGASAAEDSDVDLMFLKTLLPHIKLIPQHNKLRFQRKLMVVVETFAYGNSQTSDSRNNRSTHRGQQASADTCRSRSRSQSRSSSSSPSIAHRHSALESDKNTKRS
ncbi:transcription factor Adf-1 [Elysia marginata]|uniref:Transcription factor Adf-1 n=1 Tax=Elysia marginata TaxID=1093978 RepID=A0AAV4FWJ4_9GAST|nr:transcription factor Adf-1 [Elysia marginata]